MGQVHLAILLGWQVSVALVDATETPSTVLKELKREVESIYASASVRIDWVEENRAHLPEHAARVYILHRLPAMLETRLRAFRGRRPMAASFGETGNEGSQVIYVSRSAVSAYASNSAALSPEALGRALGRVVAHELAHRFVSREHSRVGILKKGLLPSELTDSSGELHFTSEQVIVLRRVAQPIVEPAAVQR